jgi:hypothetical protein
MFFRNTHVSAEGMYLVLGGKQARIYDHDQAALHKTSGDSVSASPDMFCKDKG